MTIAMPKSVREAWGEEAARDFVVWLDEVLQERTVPREQWYQLASRFDVLEHDMEDVKTELRELRREMNERFDRMNEQMNERFDRMNEQMNERFDRMNEQMNERFDRMNERFDQMYERIMVQTRWTVGVLALFGTIIAILVAIAQFAP
jgi:DNA anti-recombination protein RmuC